MLEKTENQKWTIQRNWQDWVHKRHGEDKQNKKYTTQNRKLKR